MTNVVEWEEASPEQVGESYEEWGKGKNRTVTPPKGTSSWVYMPPVKGMNRNPIKTGVYVHYVKDPRNPANILAVGICPSKTRSEPCSICPFLSQLRKTGNAADLKLAEDMAASEVLMANAVMISDKNPEVVIQKVPASVYKFLAQTLRDTVNGVDFTHPERARSIIIEREGEGLKTKYTPRIAANPLPPGVYRKEWLTQLHDLNSVFEELDHVGLAKTLAGEMPNSREALPPSPRQGQLGEVNSSAPAGNNLPPQGQPEDLEEDPITGKMVPRSQLRR